MPDNHHLSSLPSVSSPADTRKTLSHLSLLVKRLVLPSMRSALSFLWSGDPCAFDRSDELERERLRRVSHAEDDAAARVETLVDTPGILARMKGIMATRGTQVKGGERSEHARMARVSFSRLISVSRLSQGRSTFSLCVFFVIARASPFFTWLCNLTPFAPALSSRPSSPSPRASAPLFPPFLTRLVSAHALFPSSTHPSRAVLSSWLATTKDMRNKTPSGAIACIATTEKRTAIIQMRAPRVMMRLTVSCVTRRLAMKGR